MYKYMFFIKSQNNLALQFCLDVICVTFIIDSFFVAISFVYYALCIVGTFIHEESHFAQSFIVYP